MHGYGHRKPVWVGGLFLAVATGYFRIAGDKHYLTDVLTGAAVGTAMGLGVPLLFHREKNEHAPKSLAFAAMPEPGGASFALSWRW